MSAPLVAYIDDLTLVLFLLQIKMILHEVSSCCKHEFSSCCGHSYMSTPPVANIEDFI